MHTSLTIPSCKYLSHKMMRSHGTALLEVLFSLSLLLLMLTTLLYETQQLLKQFGQMEKELYLQNVFEAAGALLLWQLQAMPFDGGTVTIPIPLPNQHISASCERAGASVDLGYIFITCTLRDLFTNKNAYKIQTYWLPYQLQHDR